jgi:hypothetical protein
VALVAPHDRIPPAKYRAPEKNRPREAISVFSLLGRVQSLSRTSAKTGASKGDRLCVENKFRIELAEAVLFEHGYIIRHDQFRIFGSGVLLTRIFMNSCA